MAKSARAAISLILSVALLGAAWAGIRAPGKYAGVVVFDRWDGCILFSGSYLMYISQSVKEELREFEGQAVLIDAKRVIQVLNPGDGLITELEYLGDAPPAESGAAVGRLKLRAIPSFENGSLPSLMIVVENQGEFAMAVYSGSLAVALLTTWEPAKSFFPSDSPSYALITRHSFYDAEKPRTQGQGSALGQPYSWSVDRPQPRKFVLDAGQEYRIRISFSLPAGEYDFIAGYGGGVHSTKSIASNLVAFDVAEDGTAIRVDP